MFFRPAQIHAQQHLAPVLGFGATGAGMHFEIAIVAVGLAGKQCLQAFQFGGFAQRGKR